MKNLDVQAQAQSHPRYVIVLQPGFERIEGGIVESGTKHLKGENHSIQLMDNFQVS